MSSSDKTKFAKPKCDKVPFGAWEVLDLQEDLKPFEHAVDQQSAIKSPCGTAISDGFSSWVRAEKDEIDFSSLFLHCFHE